MGEMSQLRVKGAKLTQLNICKQKEKPFKPKVNADPSKFTLYTYIHQKKDRNYYYYDRHGTQPAFCFFHSSFQQHTRRIRLTLHVIVPLGIPYSSADQLRFHSTYMFCLAILLASTSISRDPFPALLASCVLLIAHIPVCSFLSTFGNLPHWPRCGKMIITWSEHNFSGAY